MARRLIFLLGGARSGKSRYAEEWARQQGGTVLFVATAEAHDADMQGRIADHQAARPTDWHTLEAPREVARHIAACDFQHETLILDCITLMTSQVLLGLPDRPRSERRMRRSSGKSSACWKSMPARTRPGWW